MNAIKNEKSRSVADYLEERNKPNEGCLTVAFACEGGGKNYQLHAKRLKNLLKERISDWERKDVFSEVREGILEQGKRLAENGDLWSGDYEGVCIHVSDTEANLIKLSRAPREGCWDGHRYRFRPAAEGLASRREMLALSLSFKNPKLYSYDGESASVSGEIELPESVYSFSDDEVLDQGQRAHVRRTGSAGEGASPQMARQGVSHEQSQRDLNEPVFLREVKHALESWEEARSLPLVVIGDESIVSEFRKLYRHAQGDFHTVTDEQSHPDERAVARICARISREEFAKETDNVLQELKSVDPENDLFNTNVKEIVRAAESGRVAACVLARDAEIWLKRGGFDELKSASAEDGLEAFEALDCIFCELVRKGAEVAVVDEEKVPGGKSLAALFRW
ncbi:hypothetical protein [Pelagicoccus sp. SDUM812005]|uniref:baeRF3 domain-containing protein n=1 Tax=Pelagicoccus sp. SDUM812005 TaxID=3041257 RepID=UPI00280F2A6F|nr:hypothetical protein [Pelagicoccus sp. SDUM812005]MDQ8181099.1 hypothetical protein [Pelagicoccus sp. SDUM812005]